MNHEFTETELILISQAITEKRNEYERDYYANLARADAADKEGNGRAAHYRALATMQRGLANHCESILSQID